MESRLQPAEEGKVHPDRGCGSTPPTPAIDPATGASIRVELRDASTVGQQRDHYREVRLVYADGVVYRGVFFRDPQQGRSGRGNTFWDDPMMVLVQDLDALTVLHAVDQILEHGVVADAFERLN